MFVNNNNVIALPIRSSVQARRTGASPSGAGFGAIYKKVKWLFVIVI